MQQQIYIFDTTLRDGQQCPGAGMSFEKNLEYAHLMAKANLDVLEAGFPSASGADFEIVKRIADEISHEEQGPVISALCQLREAQIDITIQALESANKKRKGRLHVYVPVAPELMKASLGSYAQDKPHIVEDVHRLIAKATAVGLEVEMSPEGYSRLDDNFDFTTDVCRAAISAGATIINCPDTIGGAYRIQKNYFVNNMNKHAEIIKKEFPNKNIRWSVHCHNDYGLAIDNSMNAVLFGPATQIEGCFNGIGERAGNVALEQCIMLIKHFGDCREEGQPSLFTNFKTEMLQEVSDFVSKNMLPRQPHWPITGDNSAKHTSGGHINAILKDPLAYQPFDPHEVGKDISFVFGPLSGGNHAKAIIESFGYRCDEDEKAKIAQYIKDFYSTRRKGITDDELMKSYIVYRNPINATGFDYARKGKSSTLQIQGKFFDKNDIDISYSGNDSALAALSEAIEKAYKTFSIESYNSEAIGKGIKALSRSRIVILTAEHKPFCGVGEDQDIEISALKALIDAVNQAYLDQYYKIGKS